MDILSLLSRASDVGRPGTRDILPIASLVLLVAGLVAAGAPRRRPNIHSALSAAQHLSVIGFGLLVLIVVAMSIFLQPVISGIVALLQDRAPWPFIAWLLRPLQIHEYRKRRMHESRLHERLNELRANPSHWQQTDELDSLAEELRKYPSVSRTKATRLGNILAAAEEDAGRPYGLDSRVALPRLELLLPVSAEERLTSQRDDCFFALRFCATLILGVLVSGLLLADDGIWLLVPALAAVFAWLSYRNAVSAATSYGEILRVVFDLHRFLLYDAYHLSRPADLDEEQRIGMLLSRFMKTGYLPAESRVKWK
jgi:hypothetical protein